MAAACWCRAVGRIEHEAVSVPSWDCACASASANDELPAPSLVLALVLLVGRRRWCHRCCWSGSPQPDLPAAAPTARSGRSDRSRRKSSYLSSDRRLRSSFLSVYAARCSPVSVERDATSSAGVPSNTTWPPSWPAPGPRSMIQSACAITAWWCSITITDRPDIDELVEQSEQLLDVGKVEPGRRARRARTCRRSRPSGLRASAAGAHRRRVSAAAGPV